MYAAAVGLYKQPNDFTCGPYALKHALTVLGVLADPLHLTRLARTHWWSGTDETRLARAARAYGCTMPMVQFFEPDPARRGLVRYLSEGYPTLICVDGWEHWITVVHHERGRFVVLDSREAPVVGVLAWKELEARWRYEDEDEAIAGVIPVYYDLHPVKPRFRREMRARFSVARARYLRRPEHRDLGAHWDEYLGDLHQICRPRSPRHVEPLSMGEFLRRHGDVLVERVTYWHGGIDRDAVKRVLKNLDFVADTYGMVVPAAQTRRALADVTILLTLYAAARDGVRPLYGSDVRPRRRRRARA